MYTVSEKYKTAVEQTDRTVAIVGSIIPMSDAPVLNITENNIAQGTLYLTEEMLSGSDIEVGSVVASELGFVLINDDLAASSLAKARVSLSFKMLVDETLDEWETIPLGKFTVVEAKRTNLGISLICYDDLIKFDKAWPAPIIGAAPITFIRNACIECGVVLESNESDFAKLPNYNKTLVTPISENPTEIPVDDGTAIVSSNSSPIETYLDLIMWVCQAMGSNARMTRDGTLEIKAVTSGDSVTTIDRNMRYNATISDYRTKITRVSTPMEKQEIWVGTDEQTLRLEKNPFWATKTADEVATMLNNIRKEVTKCEYVPFEAQIVNNPALQAGDFINLKVADEKKHLYPQADENGIVKTLITNQTWRFRKTHSISALGSSANLSNIRSQSSKQSSSSQKETSKVDEISKESLDKSEQAEIKASEAQSSADEALQEALNAWQKAQQVGTDFNNLQIGGRNLILDSANFPGFSGYMYSNVEAEIITHEVKGIERVVQKVHTTGGTHQLKYYFHSDDLMEFDTDYTISFFVKNIGTTRLVVWVNGLIGASPSAYYINPGEENNIVFSGKRRVDYAWFQIRFEAVDIEKDLQFIITPLMLEKGTKPTDWTPAPEDVKAEIETAKTEAENAAKTYADTKAEAERVLAEAYADGIVSDEEQARIDDVNAKLAAAKDYADAQDALLKAQQEAYADGKISTAEQAAIDAAKAYADLKKQEAEAYADGIVDAEEQRAIADAQAKYEAAQNYAVQLVNDIEIGGRNLILDSANFPGFSGHMYSNVEAEIITHEVKGIERVVQKVHTTGGTHQMKYYFHSDDLMEFDTDYTISFFVKNIGTTRLVVMVNGLIGASPSAYYINPGEENNIVFSGKRRVDYAWFQIHFRTEEVDIEKDLQFIITPLMLEKGTKPTDWTPAPEDIEEAYKAVAKAEAALAETQAKAHADRIVTDEEERAIADAQAKLDEAKKYVDDLEIGGRNLVPNSATRLFKLANLSGSSTLVDESDNSTGKVGIYEITGGTGYLYTSLGELPLKIGEIYTVSFYIKADKILDTGNISGNGLSILSSNLENVVTTDYKKVIVTIRKNADGNNNFHLSGIGENSKPFTVYIHSFQVEKGTKATDWSPAPEDVEKEINNVLDLANTKGKVIIQSSTPSTADRDIKNLWIDTTGGANTPKYWNGTAWTVIQDKAIQDAANAAAKAYNEAIQAQTMAGQAQSTADTALTSANSKNSVFHDTNAPSGTGGKVGDIWFQHDANSWEILGQWSYTGDGWQKQQLNHTAIASIDLGKATVGHLTADKVRLENFETLSGKTKIDNNGRLITEDVVLGENWVLNDRGLLSNVDLKPDNPGAAVSYSHLYPDELRVGMYYDHDTTRSYTSIMPRRIDLSFSDMSTDFVATIYNHPAGLILRPNETFPTVVVAGLLFVDGTSDIAGEIRINDLPVRPIVTGSYTGDGSTATTPPRRINVTGMQASWRVIIVPRDVTRQACGSSGNTIGGFMVTAAGGSLNNTSGVTYDYYAFVI